MMDNPNKHKTAKEIIAEQQAKKEQQQNGNPSSPEEPNNVQKSKDEAEIAANEQKKKKAEIDTELMERGYQTLEEGLADAERKQSEASDRLEKAISIERQAQEKLDALEDRELELDQRELLLSETDKDAELKLQRSEEINSTSRQAVRDYRILKEEIERLINYHNANISPCVKSLKMVSKAIYGWLEPLNEHTKYDFSKLYQYICKTTEHLERYLDTIPEYIDKDKLKK